MTNARKVLIACACVVLLLACAASVSAQPVGHGLYVGGRVGGGSMETPTVRDREGPGLKGYDRGTTAWGVFGGHEWRAAERWIFGVEIGYSDNGAATVTYASSNAYEFRSTQIDILGSVAVVHRRLTIGVKAGVGRVREQYRISTYVSGTPDLDSERARDLPVVALAFGYRLAPRIGLYADVRRTFGDVADTVTKALISSNPTPPPYRDVLNSVSRVTQVSAGLKVSF